MNIVKRVGKSLKYRLGIHLENIEYIFTVLVPINKKKIYIFHKLIYENQTRIIVSLIHKLIYELN